MNPKSTIKIIQKKRSNGIIKKYAINPKESIKREEREQKTERIVILKKPAGKF